MKEKIENLIVNWNHVFIGLITRKGFSNEELINLLNVSHSTISNWLNFHTNLDKENKLKIYKFILRLKLDIFKLEKIGRTDWKRTILLKMQESLLMRGSAYLKS